MGVKRGRCDVRSQWHREENTLGDRRGVNRFRGGKQQSPEKRERRFPEGVGSNDKEANSEKKKHGGIYFRKRKMISCDQGEGNGWKQPKSCVNHRKS